jgi:hypothetical protein
MSGDTTALVCRTMDITARRLPRPLLLLVVALLTLAALLATSASAFADGADAATDQLVLAAEQRERRPIAASPRDQLGLALYGFIALAVLAGGATLRRQLRGERPQSDGEFRWR